MYIEEYENEIKSEKQIAHNGSIYTIKFTHLPNHVRRSKYHGCPVIVGMTKATCQMNGVTYTATTECWVRDAFTKEKGEFVVAGRLLKLMKLPTELASQIGKYDSRK